jgi:hypothetical protein
MPKQAKRNKTGLPLRSIRSTPKRTTTTAKRTTTRTTTRTPLRGAANPTTLRALRAARARRLEQVNERLMKTYAPIVIRKIRGGIQEVADTLNARGIKTPRGLPWTYQNCQRLVQQVRNLKGIQWPAHANSRTQKTHSRTRSTRSA